MLEEVQEPLSHHGSGDPAHGWRLQFRILVERDRLSVLKVALGYLQNPSDAEDVAQDVFVKAYQQLRAGVPVQQLTRAWMLTVTVHSAVDRRRSSWFRRTVLMERPPESAAPDNGPEFEAMAGDKRGRVLAGVGELSLPLRQVVLLYYFGEQDVRTVAKTLHISESAVKTRLSRARERLAPVLREVWDEGHGDDEEGYGLREGAPAPTDRTTPSGEGPGPDPKGGTTGE